MQPKTVSVSPNKHLGFKRAKSIRLSDIAREARVSTTTASRVFSTPEKVRPEIILRVQAVAEKLGYLPNSAARALRSRRTRMVGAIIPTLNHAIYAKEVESLNNRLRHSGYSLVITTSDYRLDSELEQARILLERGIEALVLVGDEHDPKLYRLVADQEVPYINTYVYKPEQRHACVGFDNRLAGRKLANHLIDLGHRTIGMIGGISYHNDRARERILGVREALLENGLELPGRLLTEKPYDIASGREALRYMLAATQPPTAIVCGSDVLAFGALAECQAIGLRVPDQLSIVGFDNLEFAAHLTPPLTTIEVPAEKMGERAADFLIRQLAGDRQLEFIELEANLILRGTTSPRR
ncbi:MAG: LacI family transcriptional regulator [Verrucomicrobiota bacterium]|jgi:LacI family transcriptional regulator|nr:LacI family transcriptional regulator [Verrucomicrobiota bacterium]